MAALSVTDLTRAGTRGKGKAVGTLLVGIDVGLCDCRCEDFVE